jgi:DNA invertase Pin-like site-specific DNA recombinase
MTKELAPAIAYLRTSSAANVGPDKDSDKRQRIAIDAFAKRSGFNVVDQFYDQAVSGADPIETRPGFAACLDRIESNGVRVVIVEDASRFARHVLTQELGVVALKERGVRVYSATTGDELTETDDPSKVMMRQVAAAFAQFEKSRLVSKLASARQRKRASVGRCEGRKPLSETRPDVVAIARKLRRRKPKGGRLSLRAVSKELAARGHLNERGKPFAAKSIASMSR